MNFNVYKFDSEWQYWYDMTCRAWLAAKFDSLGLQTNDCIYAYSKDQIINYIKMEVEDVPN